MKMLLLVATAAMGAIILSGCAADETTTTTTTANPARQTYGSNELRKTGQPNTAGAIEAVDSSVQVR